METSRVARSVTEPAARSVCDLLRRRSAEQGDHRAYTFLDRGEVDAGHLTWRALDRQSHAVASEIRSRVEPRARVLLLCPPGLDFVAGLFGALRAHTIAVPAHPPCDSRTAGAQLRDLIAKARIDLVLAERTVASRVLTSSKLVPELRALPWVIVDEDPGGHLTARPESGPEPDEIAVLCPIGGSCASDGVMISHGDLLCDLAESATLELHAARSVSVSWLPATHRTGLVEGILQPVFSGSPGWLMSPDAFLERPFRWLHAISTLHATHSTAPGFAFDLCVRRVSGLERAGLDLTSWRTASSGRTLIPAATMDAFERAFGPAGFRRSAFRPLQQPAPSRDRCGTQAGEWVVQSWRARW